MSELITVYKYYKWNIYTLQDLVEQKITFSHPSTFNDPFDSYTFVDVNQTTYGKAIESTINEYYKGRKKILKKISHKYPNRADTSFSNLLHELINKEKIPLNQLKAFFNKNLLEIGHEYKSLIDYINIVLSINIFCGSNTPDNPLLWAHYADGYKGICVKYEVSGDIPSQNIDYDPAKLGKTKNLDIIQPTDIFEFYSHKTKEWQYEKEVRLFYNNNDVVSRNRLDYGNKISLKEIYVGERAENVINSTLINIFKDNANVKLYKIRAIPIEVDNTKVDRGITIMINDTDLKENLVDLLSL